MQCKITGCAFLENGPGSRWLSGDLHQTVDGSWIFNGNSINGQASWQEGSPIYQKQVWANDYWERRGVIVIDTVELDMNQAALDYLGAD